MWGLYMELFLKLLLIDGMFFFVVQVVVEKLEFIEIDCRVWFDLLLLILVKFGCFWVLDLDWFIMLIIFVIDMFEQLFIGIGVFLQWSEQLYLLLFWVFIINVSLFIFFFRELVLYLGGMVDGGGGGGGGGMVDVGGGGGFMSVCLLFFFILCFFLDMNLDIFFLIDFFF